MTRILDKLEAEGHLRREDIEGDRRRVDIVLTPSGAALAERAVAALLAVETGVIAPLAAEDRAAIAKGLDALLAAFAARRSERPALERTGRTPKDEARVVREITVIGGGAGSFNLLSGLRAQTDFALRSIVTMMDSGGDSGALRDAFGVLPPGDLRRCLVALSEESQILRDLFSFRFEEAPLEGRNFGNLFFLALTRSLGSEQQAVSALGRILKIRGDVIPVTWDHAQLVARTRDGGLLRGEAAIDGRGEAGGPAPVSDRSDLARALRAREPGRARGDSRLRRARARARRRVHFARAEPARRGRRRRRSASRAARS